MDARVPIRLEIPADLRDVVTLYLETRGADLARLDRAAATADLETVRSIGHKLRGSSQSLGFARAGEIGEDLERAAEAGDARAVERLIRELRGYLGRLRIRYV